MRLTINKSALTIFIIKDSGCGYMCPSDNTHNGNFVTVRFVLLTIMYACVQMLTVNCTSLLYEKS